MAQTVHIVNTFHVYEVTEGTQDQTIIGTGVGFTKESALEDLFKQDYFQPMLKDEIDFRTYWEEHEVK